MDYEKELQSLRFRVPIGYSNALKLLKQTKGDVELAEQLFINNAVSAIMNKTGFSESDAKKYLLASDFDIGIVLEKIENEHLSLSEQILKKYQDKVYVLNRIAGAVEESEQLKRDFWLEFDQLNKLDPESRCLMILTEWLDFLDWEGLDYAIYFHLDFVTEQLENELNLPEIAITLRETKEIHQLQSEQQQAILKKTGAVGPTSEFSRQSDLFSLQHSVLIDTLYYYVKKHINKFP